jgi:hypothetical protein
MTTSERPNKKAKKNQPHVLLWIPCAGKGQRKTWAKLKVMGVFSTKEKAEAKKAELMQEYECCGHGDIMIGGTWEDEIDLVVKPCELHLDDE